MAITDTYTKRDLAALLFKQMIDPGYVGAGPNFESLYKLPKDLQEVAYTVLAASTDRAARQRRLSAEILAKPAYGDIFLGEIQAVDPNQDPMALEVAEGWKVRTLEDAYQELPPLDWLVQNYLWRQAVGVFFGKPKSLKSLITLDLSLHVAAGESWLTRPNKKNGGVLVTKTGVLWVDLENGERTTHARVSALAKALDLPAETPFFWVSMPKPWPVVFCKINGAHPG